MKKTACILLCIIMLFSLTCCNRGDINEESPSENVTETQETSAVTTEGKTELSTEKESAKETQNTTAPPSGEKTESTSVPETGTSAPVTERTTAVTTTESTTAEKATEGTTAPSTQKPTENAPKKDVPTVYFTKDISPEGLIRIYEALGWKPKGRVAVKLSTGESSMSYFLDPELIGGLVRKVNGTIVECNTAYGGVRSSTALHKQLAKEHGFTAIANVDIMDEDGSVSLPVYGGTHLKENYVGSHFKNYDSFLILSHFKGHPMAGYGGAIKNISIGIGSPKGKCLIHTAGKSSTIMLGLNQNAFLESMADAGKSVSDSLNGGKNIAYINVMNNLSVDCDCVAIPAKPEMDDIGILASLDPVAVDQACIDLVYAQKNGDGAALVKRIESRNGLHTLESAEKIGLGSRKYILREIK